MPDKDAKIKALLKHFTPDEQAFARAFAEMKVEVEMLRVQNESLKEQHDQFWRVLVVLLSAEPEHEIRIRVSQFQKLFDEYRIDRKVEEGVLTLKLLTIHDPLPEGELN